MLQNEAVIFPGSAGVLSLGKGFDQPEESGVGTLSVVQGPGFFWSWPQPVTDRRLINLTDRAAPVTLIFPTEAEPEDLVVQFQYDVTDLTAYHPAGGSRVRGSARGRHPAGGPDATCWHRGATLSSPSIEGNSATVNEELRSGMDDFLNGFVDIANANERLTGLGIILKPRPDFSIQRT